MRATRTIPAHAPRVKATADHRRMVERQSIGFMALLLPCKPPTRSVWSGCQGEQSNKSVTQPFSTGYPRFPQAEGGLVEGDRSTGPVDNSVENLDAA
jgi:hypothetical protein